MILYTNIFLKPWAAGMALGPFIIIRPEHKEDIGLLEHEQKHTSQWWRSFGTMPFFYLLSKSSRAKYEAEAYAVQTKHPDKRGGFLSVDTAAELIERNYKLNLTVGQCKQLIEKELE